MSRIVSLILIGFTLAAASAIPCAAQVGGAGTTESIAYLKARQNADGGFSEPGASSEEDMTSWALLAGEAEGQDSGAWSNSGAKTIDYISKGAGTLTDLMDIELTALAIVESGADPRNVAGRNMVSLIKAHEQKSGEIGKSVKEHCWGLIALAAAGESLSANETGWLVSQQREDGGWGENDGVLVEDTSLAIESLVATQETDADVLRPALGFLRNGLNADGGFIGPSKVSEGQLTATSIRAIVAAGNDPQSAEWTFHGNNPVQFLTSLRASDGHFQYSKGVESQPALTTAMVLTALAGKHFPLAAKAGKVGSPQIGPHALHDLGTAGVTMRAGSQPAQSLPTSDQNVQKKSSAAISGGPTAGAFARRSTWVNGFWIFLMVGLAYLIILILALLITARVVSDHGD